MAIVGLGTRGAPLGPCSSCSPFLCLAPLPAFSRRRVLGSASAASRRHLSAAAQRDGWKGIFFIPCCGTHCSGSVKLNSRRDSRRPVFVKDFTYTTQFPAYYCTLSSYPKPDSYPDLSKVAMLKLKQHSCEPLAGGIAREGDYKVDPKGRASYDTVLHAKHRWFVASQEAKLERESQQNYQSALKKKSTINDILEHRVLRDGKIYTGPRASCKVIVSDPPAIQKGIPLDISEHVTSSRRTLDGDVSRTSPLSQISFCGSEMHVSESKVLGPECVLNNGYVADGNPARSSMQANHQQQHGINGQVNGVELANIYNKVLVVENISTAKKVVQLLTTKYKDLIYACDTEVAGIDVKQDTPVDHGEIICFSIYSGPQADFGNGRSCIWVDVLDGEKNILMEFAPFFENPNIRKVWHNYSFDCHVVENCGIKFCGFHADTMHLARLWDSSRRTEGGYSLEALTSNKDIMRRQHADTKNELTAGKTSMKSLFGKKKLKKDGSEGKLITVDPVETLQREERVPWICYSALDSVSTLKLFESLREKLMSKAWHVDGFRKGSMYDFYNKYWRPFGELLVKMESEGMLVDRPYLAEIEKVAIAEQQIAADKFRKWASKYCPDAKYMNVGSDAQIRQLLFGGVINRKDPSQSMPISKTFKVPNTDNIIEEGKKAPLKYRNITLTKIGDLREVEMYTASGWPSVSGDILKALAGKVSANIFHIPDDYDFQSDDGAEDLIDEPTIMDEDVDKSTYGLAFDAFGGGKKGKEACHAIAALCEVCSIDSLISNFILPLQGNHIAGHSGRIHCSLNINTETGRLSARRPNLQNQPALEKDRYKIRKAFVAAPGNSLIVADYGQLELRILAHLANCKSMLDAFEAGGDFHSRTAMNMYEHIREAVNQERVLLEWHPHPGAEKPPVPLLKDAFAAERRKAKMLNFSIAYGKTPVGLSRDWKVSVAEAKETVDLWYNERQEVLKWQEERKKEARSKRCVCTLLGRERRFPSMDKVTSAQKGHIERAAINTPVQGSAADVAMCAMLEIVRNSRLKELKWKLLLQVHDEVILEGPTESAEEAKAIVVDCMSKPFDGKNILKVELAVDAKCEHNWYAAK